MSRPLYTTYMQMALSLGIKPCSEQDFAEGEANRDDTPLPTAIERGVDGSVRIVTT